MQLTVSREDYRLSCEARFWIAYARQRGRSEWKASKERMIKRRGLSSVNKLIDEMNRLKEAMK